MRKYAANFEGTAYLAENDKEYEHRENYSIGGAVCIWNATSIAVGRFQKERIYDLESYKTIHPHCRGRSQHLSESTSKGKRSETADNIRRSFNAQS